MAEYVLGSATEGWLGRKVELIRKDREPDEYGDVFADEVFRIYLEPDCTVDVPVEMLAPMLNAARSSQELPASLFGDTTELVQRLDKLLDLVPIYGRKAA